MHDVISEKLDQSKEIKNPGPTDGIFMYHCVPHVIERHSSKKTMFHIVDNIN